MRDYKNGRWGKMRARWMPTGDGDRRKKTLGVLSDSSDLDAFAERLS